MFLVFYQINKYFYSSLLISVFGNFLTSSENQNIYINHNPSFCFEHSGGSVREKILKASQDKIYFLWIKSCVNDVSCLVQ